MSVWLGKREVRIMHIGRGHTAGDVVAYVPDADVVFSGDLVEYHSACYCGDAHFTDWPATLDRLAEFRASALVPGRGAALRRQAGCRRHRADRGFPLTLFDASARRAAKGRALKEAYRRARGVMDPKFASFAIYEHCMPFNVSRAYDEAKGIEHPVIWTAERDRAMWAAARESGIADAKQPVAEPVKSARTPATQILRYDYRRSADQDAAAAEAARSSLSAPGRSALPPRSISRSAACRSC